MQGEFIGPGYVVISNIPSSRFPEVDKFAKTYSDEWNRHYNEAYIRIRESVNREELEMDFAILLSIPEEKEHTLLCYAVFGEPCQC